MNDSFADLTADPNADPRLQGGVSPDASAESTFFRDVVHGLSAPQKAIPGKYLWDEKGSAIFNQICGSKNYYLTACEIALLKRTVEEVAQIVGPNSCLVEIGSGASHKTRILLDALLTPKRYVAIDISSEFLLASADRIRTGYPALEVRSVCADYSVPLPLLPIDRTSAILGLFLGTSIGNIDHPSAIQLLKRMGDAFGPSWLLIGQDPNSNVSILEEAYGGVLMAAFHKNILARMIRELAADIFVDDFEHEARFFGPPTRTEAHLVAKRPAAITIGNYAVRLPSGESIRTDVSWKYSQDEFLGLSAKAGWTPVRSWLDPDGLFGLHLLHNNS